MNNNHEAIRNLKADYLQIRTMFEEADAKNGTNITRYLLDFYDVLLRQGYTRQQLSALGISRKNALKDV